MPAARIREILAGCLLFVTLDVTAAQVLKKTMGSWNIARSERRYRTRARPYDHGLRPNVRLDAYWGGRVYPYATNSLGFRDERVRTVPLRSDAPRLLVIGDSFTEGVGVPFPDTYVGRLRRDLGAEGVDVLNAAVSSYAPSIYYRKVKYLIEDVGLDFDALLVGIDISDIYDESVTYRFDASENVFGLDPEQSEDGGAGNFAKDNSLLLHVAALAKGMLRQRLAEGTPESLGLNRLRSLWTVDENQLNHYGVDGLRRARQHMDQLVEVSRRHGIPMAVLIYPWPDQIAHGDLNSYQVSFWTAWADSAGVPLYNAFPALFAGPTPEAAIRRNFIAGDVHWNASGHRVVEQMLEQAGFIRFVRQAVAACNRRSAGAAGRALAVRGGARLSAGRCVPASPGTTRGPGG